MNLIEAIDNPALFGPWFKGSSWARWRAVLKGLYAIRMTKGEAALFREVTDRDPPKMQAKEAWLAVGRRGGKDAIASTIAAFAAGFVDYRPFLRPGERAVVLFLAVTREQASIALNYTRAYFTENELLREMVTRETADGLELNNGVDLVISTSNYRAVRGRTVVVAIIDEVAFLRDEASSNPDVELYTALKPAAATIPNAMLIGISSVYRRSGLLYEKWRAHYGQDGDVLVVLGTTRQFNPTIDETFIETELAKDPQAAGAEYLSRWRDDLAAFLDRPIIEAAVEPGVVVRPFVRGKAYHCFADASGGRSDSYCGAVAHREDDQIILDALLEIRPPFDPNDATRQVAALFKSYGQHRAQGDNYSAEWLVSAMSSAGIIYERSELDRSAIYTETMPLFTSGAVSILDNDRLVNQLVGLERRVLPGGKERITHPETGGKNGRHDDLANAACGALVMASCRPQPLQIPSGYLNKLRQRSAATGRQTVTRTGSNIFRGSGRLPL